MEMGQDATLIKVVIVGDYMVGKTQFCNRIARGLYSDKYIRTFGVDFLKFLTTKQGEAMNLTLWDTSGQSKFYSLLRVYLMRTRILIITYDITNKHSFFSIRKWIKMCSPLIDSDTSLVIVGTKCQNKDKKKVSLSHLRKDFGDLKCQFFEVSAKTGEGMDQVLEHLKELGFKIVMEEKESEERELRKVKQLQLD